MTRRNLQPLEELLVDISKRCFATSWYNGMAWWGWHFMITGPQGAGRGQITAQDVADMKLLNEDLDGGWMLYPLQRAAYFDHHRMVMAYGGGPNKVIQETQRLERKLKRAVDAEQWDRVDGFLQGTKSWW
jgi:hypothetical protein